MNRKQRERAQEKHNKGLGKRLGKTDFAQWESVLEESLHHILKNAKEPQND